VKTAGLAITPAATGINSCTVHTGSGYASYYGCAVYGTNGIISEGFHASYTNAAGSYNDSIFDHYGPYQQCAGAVCDVPYLVTYRANESSFSGDAMVAYYMRYTVAGHTSTTASLDLAVGHDSSVVHFSA